MVKTFFKVYILVFFFLSTGIISGSIISIPVYLFLHSSVSKQFPMLVVVGICLAYIVVATSLIITLFIRFTSGDKYEVSLEIK